MLYKVSFVYKIVIYQSVYLIYLTCIVLPACKDFDFDYSLQNPQKIFIIKTIFYFIFKRRELFEIIISRFSTTSAIKHAGQMIQYHQLTFIY